MSGLKNSPFGKRLRAAQDDDAPRRNRPRTTTAFSSPDYSSTPSLDSRPTTSESSAPESPPRGAVNYGDRFVPNRDNDMRTTYHLMGTSTPAQKNRTISSESDAVKEQANSLFTSILQAEVEPTSPQRPTSPTRQPTASTSALPSTPSRKRIFNYSTPSNPSTPSRRLDTPNDEAYQASPVRSESRQLLESPRRKLRSVCKTPYRVLDAPELAEDFYLNLVDWSSTNVLGVGLGSCVYLWAAHNASVSKLCDLSDNADVISSVSWVQKGSTLAVGTLSGRLHVYDAVQLKLLRTYQQAHSQRIGALAWNSHVLSSGSRDRVIHHRDVRDPSVMPFKRSTGHRQEVCGLKWSGSNEPTLASGGNDNKVCIWDIRGSKRPDDSETQFLYKFHEHTAAVKALAWDPHVAGVLATGGGTQDKHIRFWNTLNGKMLNQLDTGSQCYSHELVSTHGFSSTTAQNQICIWKYPTLSMVASLTGHTNRVLYLAMSPEGETIVTGAGDETLRFWNAFPRKEVPRADTDSVLDYDKLIR
ncbi:WD40-repeat-containing domain protein [Mucidula mucida]|nr:WD40-repeat-containing domain protein [Mucidula mucida]